MEHLKEFLDHYFFYIWLTLGATILSIFYIGGRAAIRRLGPIDLSKVVYEEKSASGYSPRAWNTGRGGARKVLHIIITDAELIITTNLLMAYIAEKTDLMHRIPLESIIQTEIKEKRFYSKLIIRYESRNGRMKDIVIASKNNSQIKTILDKYVNAN